MSRAVPYLTQGDLLNLRRRAEEAGFTVDPALFTAALNATRDVERRIRAGEARGLGPAAWRDFLLSLEHEP